MPKASPIQTSFNSGEVSPSLYGRVELDVYKSALATCFNCLPQIEGSVTRRPGSYYAATAGYPTSETRLIKFVPSDTEAYVIEVGQGYLRFFKNNGPVLKDGVPYEISTPYLAADLFQLNVNAQSADVLYICHQNYAPRKLQRFGDTAWTLDVVDFLDGPYEDVNSSPFFLSVSGSVGIVTVSMADFRAVTGAAASGAGLIRLTVTDAGSFRTGDLVTVSGVYGTEEANGRWTVQVIDDSHLDLLDSTFVNAYTYTENQKVRPDIFLPTDVGRLIRMKEGAIWGYVKITDYNSASVVSAEVLSTLTNTNSKGIWRFGLWSATTGYPAAAAFCEDRLVFGGNTAAQQRIDGSKTGDYENFAPSDTDGTVAADSAYSFNLNSDEVQAVKWLKNDEKALFVGTGAGEWPVRPSSASEAISPTNINAKQSTAYGSSRVQAIKAGKSVVYVQKTGRKIRQMGFDWESDGFASRNLTRLAEHVTRASTVAGSGIKELAWQQEPQPVLWAVRNDGMLLGLLHDETEKIMGWSRHTIGGYRNGAHTLPAVVESVTAIPSTDGSYDEVWMVVRRWINGATTRFVEYFVKPWNDEDGIENAFYMDCALTYRGTATVTITGLTHLIGETLSVLADGEEHPDVVVNGSGQVTLQRAAATVHLGYRYNSDIQTLRLEAGAADGTAQGKTTRSHRVAFRLLNTGPVKAGANFEVFGSGKLRALPVDDTPFSGDITTTWEADYALDNTICLRWDSVLPGTLLAIMPQLHTQDR